MEERIDLTQFEGIRKDWLYQEVKDSGNSEYATVNGGEFSDILFFIDRAEISEAELKALTMVPGLIAELKRMYEKEDANKPCDCEDPDYAYYWHDASGCLTVIHGAAECTECGKAWDATQEGNWTIHFDRPTDNPYTG